MERYKLLKDFLKSVNLNIAHFSNQELFCIYLQNIEGFSLPLSVIDNWFKLISFLLNKENKKGLKKRLGCLRTNEIGLDDFANGFDLANYIEYGDG